MNNDGRLDAAPLDQRGQHADLEPETAKIGTVGVVIQPRWVKNLSVTVDYYRISIKNSITTFGVPYILSQCYSETAAGGSDLLRHGHARRVAADHLDRRPQRERRR